MALHCKDCVDDKNVFCPRDSDAKCLICGEELCGAHILPHLKNEHCVAVTLEHCSLRKGSLLHSKKPK